MNYRGVTLGAAVQKLFTLMKVGGLGILVMRRLPRAARTPRAELPAGAVTLSGFGVAMIACLLSYDGWVALSFVAGEVKDPKRTLPLALALGVGLAIAIYVLANLAYLRVLSVGEIAATARVGALAAERTMGPVGGAFVSFTILMSIVGAINGWSLAAPRIYFAQAQDGLFFQRFAAIHPRFQTPLPLDSHVRRLVGPARHHRHLRDPRLLRDVRRLGLLWAHLDGRARPPPRTARPPAALRMTGYPMTLLVFAAVALGFVVNTFFATPGPAIVGTLLIGAGVPVYFIWKRMG